MKYSRVINYHQNKIANSPYFHIVNRMSKAVVALENLSLNRNPMQTEEAHISNVAKSAKKLLNESLMAKDELFNVYGNALVKISSEIENKGNIFVNETQAQEIRQALRQMPEKERLKALNNALESKDGQVIKAIQNSSSLLTGIEKEHAEKMYTMLESRVAPELVEQREQLTKDFDTSMAAIKSVKSAVNEGFDPQVLNEIETAEKSHNEAQQSFNSAF